LEAAISAEERYASPVMIAVSAPHIARPCGLSYGMPKRMSNVPRFA
jgi:hypothetical protein